MSNKFDAAEKGIADSSAKPSLEATSSAASDTPLAAGSLCDVIPPHESYEGYGHWDPNFTWTDAEEKKLVWKTDLFLLSAV